MNPLGIGPNAIVTKKIIYWTAADWQEKKGWRIFPVLQTT